MGGKKGVKGNLYVRVVGGKMIDATCEGWGMARLMCLCAGVLVRVCKGHGVTYVRGCRCACTCVGEGHGVTDVRGCRCS